MFKSYFWLNCVFAMTISFGTLAHPGHSGKIGFALNAVELLKHGAATGDQMLKAPEDVNNQVLIGNSLSFLSHAIILANIQGHSYKSQLAAKVSFLVANGLIAIDHYVDGITTWEYWMAFLDPNSAWYQKGLSVISPACTAYNFWSLVQKFRSPHVHGDCCHDHH
jgi:hypothetical protein